MNEMIPDKAGKTDAGRRYGAAAFFALAAAVAVLLTAVFSRFGVPLPDTAKYAAGVFFLVYVPGRLLVRIIRIEERRLGTTVLALLLGLTTTTILDKFARILGVEFLFFLWIGFCAAAALVRAVKRPPRPKDFEFRLSPAGIAFGLVLLALFGILFVDNYRNGIRRPDGSMVVNLRYHDGFIRNAVVRELSHTVPPQMPFAAGFPLSYHYGMDLFNSFFYRHLHIGVFDLNYRLSLTLFFALLSLMLFVLIRELSGSDGAAALGSGLVLFGGGGFSYFATLFWGLPQWGNAFYSFYFINFVNLNSFVPALAILCGGLYALARYFRTGDRGWIILSVLLLAGSLEYKMFFAFSVFGALGATAVYALAFRKDRRPLHALLGTAACAAPLLATAWLNNRGGPAFLFRLKLVDWIPDMLLELKLAGPLAAWKSLAGGSSIDPKTIGSVLMAGLIFFIGGFGLNLFGIPLLCRKIRRPDREGPMPFFLGAFVAVGIVYFFLVHVSLGGAARNITNNYVYWLVPIVLCFFWSERLSAFVAGKRLPWKILIIGLVLAVSAPNTAWMMWNKVRAPQPRIFYGDFLETAGWLNANTRPDDVILNSANTRFVCYVADRRIVLDDTVQSFPTWHMTVAQYKERQRDIARFFDEPRLNADVLSKYGVSYVWALRGEGLLGGDPSPSAPIPCFENMGTATIRKFRKTRRLKLVFRSGPNALYRVDALPEEEQDVFRLEEKDGRTTLTTFDGRPELVF